MHTNSLSLPSFLPASNRPSRTEPRRWHEVLQDLGLLTGIKARLAANETASEKAEKLVCKSARRGQRIVLGTTETPYEPLVLNGAPLAALRQFQDLEIVITTRSPEILEDLELLIELDRTHAVTVDMLIATDDPSSSDLRERLQTLATLAAEGITTRLITTDLPSESDDSRPRQTELQIRQLFKAARDCRAFDVATTSPLLGGSRLVQRLRLEYGFPRQLPGRG